MGGRDGSRGSGHAASLSPFDAEVARRDIGATFELGPAPEGRSGSTTEAVTSEEASPTEPRGRRTPHRCVRRVPGLKTPRRSATSERSVRAANARRSSGTSEGPYAPSRRASRSPGTNRVPPALRGRSPTRPRTSARRRACSAPARSTLWKSFPESAPPPIGTRGP
jgi:hypothetical protein